VRIQADGQALHLDELSSGLDLARAGEVLVVVVRLTGSATPGRVADAVATAVQEGEGVAMAVSETDGLRFSESPACSACDTPTLPLTPSLFSFNNPRGACGGCNGFGAVLEYDESLVVPDADRTIAEGAIDPWTKPRYETRRRMLRDAARKLGADAHTPWRRLKADHRRQLLFGTIGRYVGIFPFLKDLERKRYKQYIRVFLRQYQLAHTCPECGGTRLNEHALGVRVGPDSIADVSARTIDATQDWMDTLSLSDQDRAIAGPILEELDDRLTFLSDVGLGYLTIDRQMRTLSGGEAQRIALANAMGSRLVDTLYVLDEPSIGLHPRDIDRLLGLLQRLRDAGNTVVVVEHDLSAIARADWMLELGPGAGEHGGEVVYAGPPEDSSASLTGQYIERKRVTE
jgi:excinuclease ABC subunit A